MSKFWAFVAGAVSTLIVVMASYQLAPVKVVASAPVVVKPSVADVKTVDVTEKTKGVKKVMEKVSNKTLIDETLLKRLMDMPARSLLISPSGLIRLVVRNDESRECILLLSGGSREPEPFKYDLEFRFPFSKIIYPGESGYTENLEDWRSQDSKSVTLMVDDYYEVYYNSGLIDRNLLKELKGAPRGTILIKTGCLEFVDSNDGEKLSLLAESSKYDKVFPYRQGVDFSLYESIIKPGDPHYGEYLEEWMTHRVM